MTDFETHPIGTAGEIVALRAALLAADEAFAELKERLHWREDALRQAQGRFLNINIALTTDRGKAVNEAIRTADQGEDCCKMALARETLPVRIVREKADD